MELHPEILSQGCEAIRALQEFYGSTSKKMLFPEHDTSVSFSAKYKRIPLEHTSLKLIKLPKSDKNPMNASICLILPDLDRSERASKDPDVDKQARDWEVILTTNYGVPNTSYAKIFTLTQLKREYSQYSDKAKLSNTYDIFLIDSRLMLKALNILGQDFKKPSKRPFPIDSSSPKKFILRLKEAYSLVPMAIEAFKDMVTIRIGHLQQESSDLNENLSEVIKCFLENCPGGPVNIRSCYVQTANTQHTLPIYVDFGPVNDVQLQKPQKRKYEEEIGQLSTLPEGLNVKVRADGLVTVVDEKSKEEVLYPTEKDEWEAKDDIKPLTKKTVNRIVKAKARKLITSP